MGEKGGGLVDWVRAEELGGDLCLKRDLMTLCNREADTQARERERERERERGTVFS